MEAHLRLHTMASISLADFNPYSFTIISLRTFQTQWQKPALGTFRQEEKNASLRLSQTT